MTPTVELIFDADCPNAPRARARLRTALETAGLPVHWAEWDRVSEFAPDYVRRYGSPTVLVNGVDVASAAQLDAGSGCRVYRSANGLDGAPPVDVILRALSDACRGAGEP